MQLWQLRRKFHTSWLIALASGGIVVGAAVVPAIDPLLFGSLSWFLVGSALLLIAFWRRSLYLLPLAIVAGLIIGLWRGSIVQSELVAYENAMNRTVTLSGRISDDPDIGKRNETLLRLADIHIDGHDLVGKVWVSTNSPTNALKRSDIVTITGKLKKGFGSFAASMSNAKIVSAKRPVPGDVAVHTRDWFGDNVRVAIEEPQASLGLGYLVGQRRALPPELDQALLVAGLTHIVVASGYNLTILVRLARRLFVKVSKYLATLSASAMIMGFIAVTGASPSMTRAGLVSGLSLAAWYYAGNSTRWFFCHSLRQ